MKVRAAHSTGRSEPQFVIEAETEQDRLILKMFEKPHDDKSARFVIHGFTYEIGKGIISFNFGWGDIKKKQTLSSRLKKIFRC